MAYRYMRSPSSSERLVNNAFALARERLNARGVLVKFMRDFGHFRRPQRLSLLSFVSLGLLLC